MRHVHLLLLAVTLVAVGCTGDSGTDTANTEPVSAEPGAVFSWSGDDLSEWVTEDEMTHALIGVSTRYAGRDFDGAAVLDTGGGDWSWRLGPCAASGPGCPTQPWSVGVHNGDHDGRYVGPPTKTDPRLPEGVTYEAEAGFGYGSYIFSGPNSDEMIALHLWWPGGPWSHHWNHHHPEVRVHEDMTFALASMLLQELGWAD